MSLQTAEVVGSQVPARRSIPAAVSSAGQEAAELIAVAGQPLDPWQRFVLDGALGEKAGGQWAASRVGLVVPRQNGKGGVLEAKALHSLFLSPSKLMLWSAHEFKTSSEAFLRVKELVDNTDDLRCRVKSIRASHGEEGIQLLDGSRLRFVTRTGGLGRGFSPDDVILDEAMILFDRHMSALKPSLAARPNAQVWFVGSAPLVDSVVLRRICKNGRSGQSKSLAYFEWCAPRDAESNDRAAWALANPGLGIRITEDSIQSELEDMDDADFRRERLGIWTEEEEAQKHVIDPDVWKARIDLGSRRDGRIALSVDVRPDRGAASIGMSAMRSDGLRHVEVIDHRPGTGWLVGRLVELAERHDPCSLTIDPSGPAGALLRALGDAGFSDDGAWRLHVVGAREMAQACGALVDDVTNDKVRHIDQAPLNAAVSGASTRPLSDAWAWSRKDSSADISPLVAVTLARYGFTVYGSEANYDVLDSIW